MTYFSPEFMMEIRNKETLTWKQVTVSIFMIVLSHCSNKEEPGVKIRGLG